jgi:ribA/ribD-fused uncharacterized protein
MRKTIVWLGLLMVAGCANNAPSSSPAVAPLSDQYSDASLGRINSFEGPYRFLSNFYPAEIEFEGMTYPSVEHAYQSAKTLDREIRKQIAAIADPGDAKRMGRAQQVRADWEEVKFDVMETCVRYKFTHHPELKEKLLATGNAYLEEGNTWKDRIWGVYQGQGENRLGKILMKVRNELAHSSQ